MYKNIFNNTTKIFQESMLHAELEDGEEVGTAYELNCPDRPDCSYIILEEEYSGGHSYVDGDIIQLEIPMFEETVPEE